MTIFIPKYGMRFREIIEGEEPFEGDVDPSFEQEWKPARIPATPENIQRAKQFLLRKWIERHHDKYGHIAAFRNKVPTDLSDSCKFSSLFARELFGGRLRGNHTHQFVELPEDEPGLAGRNRILDLNIDAEDVKELGRLAHEHDPELFWGNPEHKEAVESCRPRVQQWVNEFLSEYRPG